MQYKVSKRLFAASVSLVALAPIQAYAFQDAAEEGGIEDIVVTARKTSESLQTTPVAVTAVPEATLTATGLKNVLDLQQSAPGLVAATGSAGSGTIAFVAIRGQGNLQPILANDPAVATYVDGVYIPRPSVGQSELKGIQRVEVLRGPQGTLFGRNTTGGAINILTKDPSDEFSGYVRGEVGNRAQRGFEAGVNVPLTSTIAARVDYSFRDSDGNGDNLTRGNNLGDQKSNYVRGKIKYDGEGFAITLAADYNKITDHGQLAQLAAINPLFAGSFGALTYDGVTYANHLANSLHNKKNWWAGYSGGVVATTSTGADLTAGLSDEAKAYYGMSTPFNLGKTYGFSATIEAELGSLDLKSITAYRNSKDFSFSDSDGTPAPVLGTFAGSHSDYVSEELQVSGDITERLSFIAGGYLAKEEGYEFSRSQIFGGRLRNSIADITNKTFGLFAQAYYDVTDSVRAVGGFRYTWDKRDSVLHNQQIFGLPANYDQNPDPAIYTPNCNLTAPDQAVTLTQDQCNKTQKAKFDYPAWMAGLDWTVNDDLFVYIKTSGAAKAGGWNLRAGGLPAFAPEKVKDVELGFKSDFLDNHVRLNVAAFHLWKTGNQAIVNSFVEGIGVTQYIQNNGDTRAWGLETELTVVPWTGMEITANAAFQDGKYKKGSFTETQILSPADFVNCATPDTNVTNGCVVDLSGQNLIQFPKTQINIAASQSVPLNDNTTFKLWGNYAYIGSQVYGELTVAPESTNAIVIQQAKEVNALSRIKGYGIFNMRASITLEEPNIELAGFVRNVANKKYLARRFGDLYPQLGFGMEFAGQRRMYGMSVGYKF